MKQKDSQPETPKKTAREMIEDMIDDDPTGARRLAQLHAGFRHMYRAFDPEDDPADWARGIRRKIAKTSPFPIWANY